MTPERPRQTIRPTAPSRKQIEQILAGIDWLGETKHRPADRGRTIDASAENTANVLQEINGIMQVSTTKKVPAGILATIELLTAVHHWMDAANAKNMKEKRPAEAAGLERSKAEETLHPSRRLPSTRCGGRRAGRTRCRT
jgi:hypothetical protein